MPRGRSRHGDPQDETAVRQPMLRRTIRTSNRFIFLKTVKTASSSIEIALSSLCGPDDVITPTREDLDEQRAIRAQNFRLGSIP